MAAERLSMRKVSEALRQHAEGRSARSMAQSLGVAHSTVLAYLRRARTAGLGWPLPAELTEGELEQRLFPPPPARGARPQPDWSEVHRELRRKGVVAKRSSQVRWLRRRAPGDESPERTIAVTLAQVRLVGPHAAEHSRNVAGVVLLTGKVHGRVR